MHKELKINLQDTEWKYDYIDHDRNIARAFVYDENGYFYFVRANRDDDFGKATLIETAGGGVEDGTNKFVPSERAREGFALILEMKEKKCCQMTTHLIKYIF